MSFRIYPDSNEVKNLENTEEKNEQNFIAEKRARTREILSRLKKNSPLAYGYAMLIDALLNDINRKEDN